MKRSFNLTITVLALILACVLAFAACDKGNGGETSDTTEATEAQTSAQTTEAETSKQTQSTSAETTSDTTEASVVTTVTAEQWKESFIISDLESFTFKFLERAQETVDVWQVEGVYKYCDGMAYCELVEKEDGEIDETETIYAEYKFERINHMDTAYLSEILWELEEFDDYGYSTFTYSETTGAYTRTIDLDVPVTFSIWFADGNITKIAFNGEGLVDDGDAFTVSATYEFVDINSTAKIVIPADGVAERVALGKAGIANANVCSYDNNGEVIENAEVLADIKSFIGNVTVGELNQLLIDGGHIDGVGYRCAETTVNIAGISITYDEVYLYFGAPEYISYVKIGEYYFFIEYPYNL